MVPGDILGIGNNIAYSLQYVFVTKYDLPKWRVQLPVAAASTVSYYSTVP